MKLCFTNHAAFASSTPIDSYRSKQFSSVIPRRNVLKVVVSEGKTSDQKVSYQKPKNCRLILLRHAKSSWDDPSLKDHERPLNKKGRLDAANVAAKLKQLGWLPQLILSSDAARTCQTLQIMQEQVREFLQAKVHFVSSFYSISQMDGQTAQHLQQAVCQHSTDDTDTVMCMGHNKGWEEAASMFCGFPVELKTSNAALLQASGRTWEEAFSLAGFGGWNLIDIVTPDKCEG